jgi:hypothetical protein
VPFTSIQSFGPHDAAVKAAMGSLETSHDLTTLRACKLVEWSHGHLSMVIALVGSLASRTGWPPPIWSTTPPTRSSQM